MGYLIPEARAVFALYFGIFFLFMLSSDVAKLDNVDQFSLSVYACFAIAVLWEWPIQLAIHIKMMSLNPSYADALILSSLKAIAIPLFFYRAYKLGWSPSSFWLFLWLPILTIGEILTLLTLQFGPEIMFWWLHLYRLPWLLLLLAVIGKLYIIRHK